MIKKLNNYFFDSDVIHISDALWFYGFMSFLAILAVTHVIPMWIKTIFFGGW